MLIAGHHGSNNASSYALLKHVKPDHVVFSAGYSNRFGHPHNKVIERVEQFTNNMYNTAMTGALIFNVESSIRSKLEGEILSVKGMRSGELPFWILKGE